MAALKAGHDRIWLIRPCSATRWVQSLFRAFPLSSSGLHPLALPRAAAFLAAFLVFAPLAWAQPPPVCDSCLANAHCEADDQACLPACRARFFNVDPRRRDCLAQCATARKQCERAALTTCRSRLECP
jgi:hypothetical protein